MNPFMMESQRVSRSFEGAAASFKCTWTSPRCKGVCALLGQAKARALQMLSQNVEAESTASALKIDVALAFPFLECTHVCTRVMF